MEDHITTNVVRELTDDLYVQDEILAYAKNKFVCNDIGSSADFKRELDDEYFVKSWYGYLEETKAIGVFETLKKHLVQLRFPISENISKNDSYRAATLRGKDTSHIPEAKGLMLRNPEGLVLQIYPSIGGNIPVLIVDDSEDFKSLIQAFCYRNEPVKIPESMGAVMINGLNNWSKIEVLKNEFLASNSSSDWPSYFKNQLIPNKSLYQDKMIVLAKKPYSNVSAEVIGMNQKDWIQHSLTIRLEHECAHYFTLRHYGTMANNMHDELIADYAGICASYGRYNAEWFLKFIGLEAYPNYRKGARLENYLGSPKLSERAFEVLKTIIYKAVRNIHTFDSKIYHQTDHLHRRVALKTLCSFSIVEMAQDDGADKLYLKFNTLKNTKNFLDIA
ncbi:hypothetical protein [uncultured Dokdonia sp.]|uniref:DUF7005 family protein n=1 Tax=uncultured Dokdonia sp. TaxID=575653 RepID=UPI002601FB6F|nr:hypothetical protein [uncultured Dokdonia sp.]